jgi:hypothetical protein
MARQQLKDYKFTPGGAGVGTVKIPGNYDIADILTVLNATDQTFIYNFADPELGGIVSFSKEYDADFPQAQDGVTTLTLLASTSTMSANDNLALYIETEAQYIRPWPFGTDAVERMRVANPQSLIDADFEYGLQNTKWQSVSLNNDVPSIYELPGSELIIDEAGYASFIAAGTISSTGDTSIDVTNQSGVTSPNWQQNDFALVVNPYVANPPPTTYITANVLNSNQRSITVANAQPFSAGDEVFMVQLPQTNTTTLATLAITSGATTTFTLASTSGIIIDDMLLVQTNTTDLWELVCVTGVASPSITVVRRRLGTNSGNVNINIGNGVRKVTNVEVGQVSSIDQTTVFSINRGWMNTDSVPNMISGSVIQKLNKDPGTSSGANVEIVRLSTIGTTAGNVAVIVRGQLGTTAISSAPEGSPIIRLTGIFQAGNQEIPLVGIYLPAHDITANSFISTGQHSNSNTEGLYQVIDATTNYITYYPRILTGLTLGYTLNKFDTQVRKSAAFAGATLPVSTITSDGLNPSTITVTTPYNHGLSPGTPILVDIDSGAGNIAYGDGSFSALSIPTPTTFTYQAKTGRPVTGSITGNIYIRPSSFFVHRPFDGGVLIGSGTPHRGAMTARQSKKYFRYQSGKGLVWTSGTLLSTNFDLVNVAATGTAISGNTISITTEVEHYLQIGANIRLSDISTPGYNGYYRVSSIVTDSIFEVPVNQELGSTIAKMGQQPKVNLIGWHGGAVRAGIFDEQNGAFWENNGVNINVVLRSATFQLAGTLSVETGSSYVAGDGSCRFLEQLKVYDRVVIRGMSHTVTGIIDNNAMIVSPAWRGVSNQTRVKASRVIDQRIPQSQFNIDKVDGTGPSGYILDASKMQMLLIQYTWYGAGFVDFGLRGPLGNYIMCHRIQNNNINDEAYMRSGNLPVRYSANNEGETTRLAIAANASVTSFTVQDDSQFPAASVAFPFYVQIENEVVKVQGHTIGSNIFNNCTRGATFTLWQDGSSKSFTMGSAATHASNVAVSLLDCTSSPTLNHWGSAVIMDGGFDQDRGYAFTFSRNNMALPTSVGAKSTVFLMRLAPSVSNTIIGDIGQRDLINRAQLILENMIVNVTGGRFQIDGILNPTNVNSGSIEWIDLNAENNGNQPSFTQFATAFKFNDGATGGVVGALRNELGGMGRSGLAPSTGARYINYAKLGTTPGMTTSGSGIGANISVWKTGTFTATVNSSSTQIVVWETGSGFSPGDTITVPGNIWATSTTSTSFSGVVPTNNVTLTVLTVAAGVSGGERLFAIPVSTTNSGFLDLTKVKQVGTSAIPGNGIFPDGPEVLAINVTAINPTSTATGDFQITFSETQA